MGHAQGNRDSLGKQPSKCRHSMTSIIPNVTNDTPLERGDSGLSINTIFDRFQSIGKKIKSKICQNELF